VNSNTKVGNGELNKEEFTELDKKLKEDPLFKADGFVIPTFDDCIKEQEENLDEKNGDKNELLDIDEALLCFKLNNKQDLKFSRCKVDTNQTGVLYIRRINESIKILNEEVGNLQVKRSSIETQLEAVNNELRKLQDELDEDTAI